MGYLSKKRVILLMLLVLLYAVYTLFLSRKLSPPADSEQITVSFRVPEGVTLLPLGGLYVSSKCTTTHFTAGGRAYQVSATKGVSLPFVSQGEGNLRTASIAKDGGGRCRWMLSSVWVGFRLSEGNPLLKGKEVIETSYDFDISGYDDSGGSFGIGREKEVYGDLKITTDFFPMIFISHTLNKTTLELFGGDTKFDKWSRRYRLSDTTNIYLSPRVYIDKPVIFEAPNPRPGKITVLYPDGSRSEVPRIAPDYDKLRSMK